MQGSKTHPWGFFSIPVKPPNMSESSIKMSGCMPCVMMMTAVLFTACFSHSNCFQEPKHLDSSRGKQFSFSTKMLSILRGNFPVSAESCMFGFTGEIRIIASVPFPLCKRENSVGKEVAASHHIHYVGTVVRSNLQVMDTLASNVGFRILPKICQCIN